MGHCLQEIRSGSVIKWELEDGLFSIPKVCYNSLAAEEKEMFLGIAACFHAEELNALKRLSMDSVRLGIG